MALRHLWTRPCRESPTPRAFDHLFVMIDKFTKWIEAKPVATASSEMTVEFIKEFTNRYGVMNTIITNNDTQFIGSAFVNFCDEQQINV